MGARYAEGTRRRTQRGLLVAIVVGVSLSSCRGEDAYPGPIFVYTGARDLETGYPIDPAAADYPLWVDTTELPAGHVSPETLRVVRWPSQEVVDGAWRPAHVDAHWRPSVSRFEATEPLPRGWYAVQARMPEWFYSFIGPSDTSGQSRFPEEDAERWHSQRVRLGAQPTVRLHVAENGQFGLFISENLVLQRDHDMLELVDYQIDGRSSPCRSNELDRYPLPRGASFNGFSLVCDPAPPASIVRLTFGDGLVGAEGLSLIDFRGVSPPTWTIDPTASGTEQVPESYFLLEPATSP